ncbi:CLUMA_CG006802, isoform A [Clunio marinus]|uniref:CLUMA_CG006802, isoform A n=1 Tax=Clunio marinus TaxID=568069 RepID=A0A1J1HZ74_9DIPT|nr:CLUMA_CG006802, isoform A [Clunio marinus]
MLKGSFEIDLCDEASISTLLEIISRQGMEEKMLRLTIRIWNLKLFIKLSNYQMFTKYSVFYILNKKLFTLKKKILADGKSNEIDFESRKIIEKHRRVIRMAIFVTIALYATVILGSFLCCLIKVDEFLMITEIQLPWTR